MDGKWVNGWVEKWMSRHRGMDTGGGMDRGMVSAEPFTHPGHAGLPAQLTYLGPEPP